MHRFETDFWLPVTPAEACAFFADARNLDVVTPPWFRFTAVTPLPVPMRAGTTISYRLRWRWLTVPWRSRITDWRPPDRFTYQMERGPFRRFHHLHLFRREAGGTRILDRIDYAIAGGRWPARRWIDADLRAIFEHRARRASGLLAEARGAAAQEAAGDTAPEPIRSPWTRALSSPIEPAT